MVSQAPTRCGHPINVNLLFALTLFYFFMVRSASRISFFKESQAVFIPTDDIARFSEWGENPGRQFLPLLPSLGGDQQFLG